jgi:hypothetical protein
MASNFSVQADRRPAVIRGEASDIGHAAAGPCSVG